MRIGQVITNLLDNARSFVPDEDGRINVACAAAGERIVVIVEDNGPGIRAEHIERIFERFYTDRPGRRGFRPEFRPRPVDLRQIVEAHGGTLTAENTSANRREIRRALRRLAANLEANG